MIIPMQSLTLKWHLKIMPIFIVGKVTRTMEEQKGLFYITPMIIHA